MGRTVYADESTEKYIQELIKGKSWYIGLIIGQVGNDNHLDRCFGRYLKPVSSHNTVDVDDFIILCRRLPILALLYDMRVPWLA